MGVRRSDAFRHRCWSAASALQPRDRTQGRAPPPSWCARFRALAGHPWQWYAPHGGPVTAEAMKRGIVPQIGRETGGRVARWAMAAIRGGKECGACRRQKLWLWTQVHSLAPVRDLPHNTACRRGPSRNDRFRRDPASRFERGRFQDRMDHQSTVTGNIYPDGAPCRARWTFGDAERSEDSWRQSGFCRSHGASSSRNSWRHSSPFASTHATALQ
jgi:hypothetical protein